MKAPNTPRTGVLTKQEIAIYVRLGVQSRTLPALIARFNEIDATATAIGPIPELLARGLKRAKFELLMLIAAQPAKTPREFEERCCALATMDADDNDFDMLKIMAAASIEVDVARLRGVPATSDHCTDGFSS